MDVLQISAIQAFLPGGVIPFGEQQARLAARLYNAIGRPRRLRVDAMIAASAISLGAPLATLNREDFLPFVAHGLELATPLE